MNTEFIDCRFEKKKVFVIMANDYPQAVVQCEDEREAEKAATILAEEEFKKNEAHWKHEHQRHSFREGETPFEYYRQRVYWRPNEKKLLEYMFGRLVSVQDDLNITSRG